MQEVIDIMYNIQVSHGLILLVFSVSIHFNFNYITSMPLRMTSASTILKLVEVLSNLRNTLLESLALPHGNDRLLHLSSTVHGSIHGFPVIE